VFEERRKRINRLLLKSLNLNLSKSIALLTIKEFLLLKDSLSLKMPEKRKYIFSRLNIFNVQGFYWGGAWG
jgi:hypothetical protein